MRRTHATVLVAESVLSNPDNRHWGYQLRKETGLRSGVLYPVLHRMLAAGWLEDGWEDHQADTKRPPRRYYELTDLGRIKLGALLVPRTSIARGVPRTEAAW